MSVINYLTYTVVLWHCGQYVTRSITTAPKCHSRLLENPVPSSVVLKPFHKQQYHLGFLIRHYIHVSSIFFIAVMTMYTVLNLWHHSSYYVCWLERKNGRKERRKAVVDIQLLIKTGTSLSSHWDISNFGVEYLGPCQRSLEAP